MTTLDTIIVGAGQAGLGVSYLRSDIVPPPLKLDPADLSDPQAECVASFRQLNLREAKVSTVIWATGFTSDFSWIQLPVLGTEGGPIYQ